ncbi:hypothetical protein M408DRAFT_328546 [Serendipita vermifera MAFF 305830]|uniref:BTB domain-containing protein n=1 Tax=Serendipita vermifera MAFF 305830 TaxID=933852 RepID=A0A0C3BE18_SERVB|nr:hypothetical protein M408DRAFT_328546 [Serendipita vermifera MAFF 305830]
MADPTVIMEDYSTGVPRRHHSLYLEDGTFVMQVENAIFKVHRFFLAKYSSALKDMFNVPQGLNIMREGSEENPVLLNGDSATGWELLLGDIYSHHPIIDVPRSSYTGDQLLLLLQIAHKYCMDTVEVGILKLLELDSTTDGLINRIVASRIVGSESIYDRALKKLISSKPMLTETQVRQIGIEALYPMFTELHLEFNKTKVAQAEAENKVNQFNNMKCRHCPAVSNWKCGACSRHQKSIWEY